MEVKRRLKTALPMSVESEHLDRKAIGDVVALRFVNTPRHDRQARIVTVQ